MPPRGRKFGAKSNGVNKSKDVEELPATNIKKMPKSGRMRKMAEDEEIQEVEPSLEEEAIDAPPKKENGSGQDVSSEDKPDIAEENVNGKGEEPEETATAPAKRGRKKAKATQDKKAKTNEISSDEITSTEAASGKHGAKKAADQTSAEQKQVKSAEGVESENPAAAEPEKVSGKRGRKKAVDPILPSEEEKLNAKQELLKAVAGPSKRGRKAKPDAAAEEPVADVQAEDDDDFAPRKTRGGRSAKEVAPAARSAKEVAPAARGTKRKVIAEVKESKKEKVEQAIKDLEIRVLNNYQLTVDIERNEELEEMAKNSSKEEEEINDDITEKEEDVKADKASKSGRKRANKNVEDAKPAKAPKKEAAEKKSASVKEPVPDTTSTDFENSSKSPDGKPWNLKIVSWNVNGIRAWLEKDGLNYLHLEKPDIMCVQETKCSVAKLPSKLTEVEGYHCHWLAAEKEGYSGVGMFYKNKPISIEDGIGIEEHDNEGRVITAEYEKFYLVTSYVPNAARGLTRLDYRMKWDNDFRTYLKKLDKEKPVILCGDLNVAHEEIDLANPKSNKKNAGFTQEERDGFSTLLKEGFVDTFRHHYPDTKDAYTFWTFMMNARAKNVGWRIDYFVVSERFTDHLCDSAIRKNVMGSDHCPIVLFLHV